MSRNGGDNGTTRTAATPPRHGSADDVYRLLTDYTDGIRRGQDEVSVGPGTAWRGHTSSRVLPIVARASMAAWAAAAWSSGQVSADGGAEAPGGALRQGVLGQGIELPLVGADGRQRDHGEAPGGRLVVPKLWPSDRSPYRGAGSGRPGAAPPPAVR